MNLKTKELERYSRQIIIKDIGISGQKKIKNSKVLIVGLGGLGCPVAEYLSRTGVGTIGLIDHDKIDLSNIHRQSMFTTKDIGKYKVKVVKLMDFGAFVNFMGSRDGLVHISQLKNERVEKVSDVINEGDVVKVKVLDIDSRGKVKLSMKEVEAD